MKRMNFKRTTVIMLALLLVAGFSVNAQRGRVGQRGAGMYGQGDMNAGRGGVCYGLNLSDEQQQQIDDLRVKHFKEVQPLRDEMFELKARQRTLMNAVKPDVKAINDKLDKISDIQNKLAKLRVDHRLKVRNILTDEQVVLMQSRSYGNGRGQCGRYGRGYGSNNWGGPAGRMPARGGRW